jgi:hypothetical protein
MWAFILQEYDFDIIHKSNKVNQDVNGLSRNQVPMRRIPVGFLGMVMWIWRRYQDGMPLHTFVLYWGVLGMYLRLVWMMEIPMMWT